MKEENWIWINGFEGSYMISDLGNIMSYRKRTGRYNSGNTHRAIGRVLKPQITPQGYAIIRLYNDDKTYSQHSIHSLMMYNWVGDRPTEEDGTPFDIDHINKIRSDNRLVNLQYMTHQENVSKIKFRDSTKRKKPILQYDMDGNFIREYESASDARILGYDRSEVGKCARGKKTSYKGFVWVFKNDKDFIGGK